MSAESTSPTPTDSTEGDAAVLNCPFYHCGQQFVSNELFMVHLCQHSVNTEADIATQHYRCYLCSQTFYSSYLLHLHLLTFHMAFLSDYHDYKTFPSLPMKRSNETESADQYLTDFYHDKTIKKMRHHYPDSGNLSKMLLDADAEPNNTTHTHSSKHTRETDQGNDVDEITCSRCGHSCDNREQMYYHRVSHSCADWLIDITSTNTSNMTSQPHLMIQPSRESHYQDSLIQSKETVFKTEYQREDKMSTASTEFDEDCAFDAIRSMKTRGEFPCRLCGQIFPNLRAMKGHNRIHMTSAPYECNVCNYSSHDKAALVRHMKDHNGERLYECRLCRYSFTTKANCERHLKNRHKLSRREELSNNLINHGLGESMEEKKDEQARDRDLNCTVKCPVCHTVMEGHVFFNEHILECRDSTNEVTSRCLIECTLCRESFSIRQLAIQHVRLDHEGCNPDEVLKLRKSQSEMGTYDDVQLFTHNDDQNSDPSCDNAELKDVYRKYVCWSGEPFTSEKNRPKESLSLADSGCQQSVSVEQCAPLDLSIKSSCDSSTHSQQQPQNWKCGDITAQIQLPNLNSIPLLLMSGLMKPMNTTVNTAAIENILAPYLRLPIHRDASRTDEIIPFSAVRTSNTDLDGDHSAEESNNIASKKNTTDKSNLVANRDDSMKPKQRRYRTQRPFSCAHCNARFTLSTNMDRHVKNHHPDKWQRKSRGGRRHVAVADSDHERASEDTNCSHKLTVQQRLMTIDNETVTSASPHSAQPMRSDQVDEGDELTKTTIKTVMGNNELQPNCTNNSSETSSQDASLNILHKEFSKKVSTLHCCSIDIENSQDCSHQTVDDGEVKIHEQRGDVEEQEKCDKQTSSAFIPSFDDRWDSMKNRTGRHSEKIDDTAELDSPHSYYSLSGSSGSAICSVKNTQDHIAERHSDTCDSLRTDIEEKMQNASGENVRRCGLCGRRFENTTQLSNHMYITHVKKVSAFSETICTR